MTSIICGCLGGAAAGEAVAAMFAVHAGDGRADEAHWTDGAVALGVRSTSVPDSSLRMHQESGVAVAAAARLDDREGLCDLLNIRHAERPGLADADLVLRAYMRWGRLCPERLLGDFAFAVWDSRRRTLFCARDPIGVRPFYYARMPTVFVFGGTVDAVVAAPGVPDALDEVGVAAFLTRSAMLGTRGINRTRTLFKAVRKLPPGHALTVKVGTEDASAVLGRIRTKLERHWRPEQAPLARPAADEDYAEQFLELYERAVRDRLHGPDPVGVHLSGGLDSSSIAALAARALRREGRPPPLAFSWLPVPGRTPPDERHASEYDLIHDLCAREGLQVHHRSPSPEDVAAVLQRDGAYPGVQIHINEEAVQRCAAAQGVRVLLSGWGGDEGISFNGRGYNAYLLLSGRWRTLHAICRAQGGSPLRFLADVLAPLLHPRLPFHLLRRRPLWGPRSHRALERRRWLINPAFARRVRPPPHRFFRQVSLRRTQLRIMQDGRLDDRIEGWAASGLRHGVEYRYPLLDRRVLEFALGLPPDQYRRGPWSRWLMRYALSLPGGAVLPDGICWNRSKSDPIRYESTMDAFAESLPIVRRRIEALAGMPSRARYVDLPRLLTRLDADRFRSKRHFAAISNALMLLDF